MPFKHQWYIEGEVIYSEVWGDQTLEELMDSNATITQYLDKPTDKKRVHIIMNDAKLQSIPVSLTKIRKALSYAKHPKLGCVIMIGEKEQAMRDVMLDSLLTILAKLSRACYIRLKTLDEATQHLQLIDDAIHWNKANHHVESNQ